MSTPRPLRGLVGFEIAAVIAVAVIPFPPMLPVSLPLLVAATASRWIRGRSWTEVVRGGGFYAAVGAGAGLAALLVALAAGTPLVEAMSGRAVEWSTFAIVRGNAGQLVAVAIMVGVAALAGELALRGWLVERVLELSPGSPVLPVMLGAIAEAVVTRGDFATRTGAALFGAGLGAMYVASGRSVVAPICARVTFQVGAIVLEALRVVG